MRWARDIVPGEGLGCGILTEVRAWSSVRSLPLPWHSLALFGAPRGALPSAGYLFFSKIAKIQNLFPHFSKFDV